MTTSGEGVVDTRFQQAREYIASGLSLIPIAANSKTTPERFGWKTYQSRRPTDAELRAWVKRYPGLGIVGGKVSGNGSDTGLEIIDLESIAPLDEFRELVKQCAPGLLGRLPRVETPTGGRHVYYRCETVKGNQKLAERAEEVADLPHKDDGTLDTEAIKKLGLREINGQYFKIKTLIETRGEGGQVLSPLCLPGTHPSGGVYRLINGDLCDIPTITTEERDILLSAARACNEFIEPTKAKGVREADRHKVEGLKPGADYNERSDAFEKSRALLEEYGWGRFRSDSLGELWARPGVNDHCSGRLFNDGALYIFSTNAAPFDAGETYKPFAIYAVLKHGGDYSAAAKALAAEGFGDKRQAQRKKADKQADEKTGAAKIEADEDDQKAGDKPPSDTKAGLLIQLVESNGVEFFHDSRERAFAIIPKNGHRETHAVNSKSFRSWSSGLFWKFYNSGIHNNAWSEASGVFACKAIHEGKRRETYVRIASADDRIYLDLCNEYWQQVEITANQWRVIDASESPVQFRRAPGMEALPVPIKDGDVNKLRGFLNAEDDNNWHLLLAWLIMAFKPRGPYPILIVSGEQGSAKSTCAKLLSSMIDPNTASLRTLPKDERDLFIAATNSWVLRFDNLSGLSKAWSDALCRISTGAGHATRMLYENDEESIFQVMRSIVLTGIGDLASQGDLLDRSVQTWLPQIPDDKRKAEEEIEPEFEEAKPAILGGLLNAVQAALPNYKRVKLESLPRMADFARWVTAAEGALGWEPGSFIQTYTGNRLEANEIALEGSPVAEVLREFIRGQAQYKWNGTSTDLLNALNNILDGRSENREKKEGWPKRANGLSNTLSRLAPNLRKVGIDIQREKGGQGKRSITITYDPEKERVGKSSPPSPPSPPAFDINNLDGGDQKSAIATKESLIATKSDGLPFGGDQSATGGDAVAIGSRLPTDPQAENTQWVMATSGDGGDGGDQIPTLSRESGRTRATI